VSRRPAARRYTIQTAVARRGGCLPYDGILRLMVILFSATACLNEIIGGGQAVAWRWAEQTGTYRWWRSGRTATLGGGE